MLALTGSKYKPGFRFLMDSRDVFKKPGVKIFIWGRTL
jgi:hypothetical protein